MSQSTTTALPLLCGSYFHQDFSELSGTSEETVGLFLRENPTLAGRLADEAHDILASNEKEADLRSVAVSMHSYYAADWDGGTYRQWFTEIEAQARAYAAEHPPT